MSFFDECQVLELKKLTVTMCAWSSNIVKPAKFQIIISSLTVQFSSSNILAKSKCLLEKLTLV